ncbi:hypothetical protein ILUMI_19239 [Ignelater luminosus]|uniref:Uncharacterized protein n=1 Tax=Ignelater luminosus TaxID=2038154 RepID=A0A8K0G626_IGNLU|nr:hypothetical protein ILUMI_19239 [Ignelater luminosus]
MSELLDFKLPEERRERFQKYLEEINVLDNLAKILKSLYEEPEKPEDPLRYVCDKLLTEVYNETLDSLIKLRDQAEDTIIKLQKKCVQLRHPKELVMCNESVAHAHKRAFGIEKYDKEVLNSEIHIELLQEDLTDSEHLTNVWLK